MDLIEDALRFHPNRMLLDFGPPLNYPVVSKAFTVEKLTLWQYNDEKILTFILLRANYMTRARVEGTVYSLGDDHIARLDKRMGVGVKCDRKIMPIYLQSAGMARITAYVYLGRNAYWSQRLGQYDPRIEKYVLQANHKLSLVGRETHTDSLLNGRFVFLPDPINNHSVRSIRPEVIQRISTRNSEMSARLEDLKREREQEIIDAIHDAQRQKRAQIRRSIASFFSNEL